jgi:hypothetical protein
LVTFEAAAQFNIFFNKLDPGPKEVTGNPYTRSGLSTIDLLVEMEDIEITNSIHNDRALVGLNTVT